MHQLSVVRRPPVYTFKFKLVVYILLLVIYDQQKYSEKSENIIGLDSYILNSLNHLNLVCIYISHCITSLLKLEISLVKKDSCRFWLVG